MSSITQEAHSLTRVCRRRIVAQVKNRPDIKIFFHQMNQLFNVFVEVSEISLCIGAMSGSSQVSRVQPVVWIGMEANEVAELVVRHGERQAVGVFAPVHRSVKCFLLANSGDGVFHRYQSAVCELVRV